MWGLWTVKVTVLHFDQEHDRHVSILNVDMSHVILSESSLNVNTTGRNALFEKGIEFERKGKPGLALQCYLACIQGLDGQVEQFPQVLLYQSF